MSKWAYIQLKNKKRIFYTSSLKRVLKPCFNTFKPRV